MQIVAGQRRDGRAAAPIGPDARAESVVRPSGLRLDAVARRPAGRARGRAVQIVELGPAGCNPHFVDEGDGVGQRELQPAAAVSAAKAAEAATTTPAAATETAEAGAAATAFRASPAFRRRAGRRCGALRTGLGARLRS